MPPQYIIHYHKGVQMDCSKIRRCLLQTIFNPCPLILQAVVLYALFAAKCDQHKLIRWTG